MNTVILSRFRTVVFAMAALAVIVSCTAVSAKVRTIGTPMSIRPLIIRNVAYNARGTVFSLPNNISAGSVSLFWVDEKGSIAPVPSRLSEKNFVHSAGLFFLRKKRADEPSMAFISLPELLTGYSVDFCAAEEKLAVAGAGRVYIYKGDGEKWGLEKEVVLASQATRAVFSNDGKRLAVITEGRLLLFSTADYRVEVTVEPLEGSRFCDVAFSHDNSRCALFEFRAVRMDFGARVRLFNCATLQPDRELPWFSQRPTSEPGVHFPLVSFGPADTTLAVTLPATIAGKVYLIKSNDGSIVREFKGYCHAFSPDQTLFAADNAIFSTRDWTKLGAISGSTITCAFSPTERVLVAVTNDAIKRYRVEE